MYCDRHAGVMVETSVAESIVRFELHTVIHEDPSAKSSNVSRICRATAAGCTAPVCSAGAASRRSRRSDGGRPYVDSTRMGTFDGEVTEFAPPTRIASRETLRWFSYPIPQARPEYSLEGDESATVVHHVAVGELYGWMRFHEACRSKDWMANRERSRTLNSLKRSLESN